MRTLLTLLSVVLASPVLAAEPATWPQFRGPGGGGVAPESANPSTRIGPDTNVKWKITVPAGFSSPVIAGDRLFLTGFSKKKLLTLAYRRTDGKELWRREAPADKLEPFAKGHSSPAASTPATDGKRLVVYFGSCGLICYDLDGKQLWRYRLSPGKTEHDFGTGSSPILADSRVVLLRDFEVDSQLLCLDLATGERVWQTRRDGCRTSWGSACLWSTPAGKQVVVAGGLRLVGYDLKDGKEVWRVKGLPSYQCTTPVVVDGDLVYAGWSYGGESDFRSTMPSFDDLPKKDRKITRKEWDAYVNYKASGRNVALSLKPGGKGDLTNTPHVRWRADKGLPYLASPLVYRGLMYTVTEHGLLSSHDVKTGKPVQLTRRVRLGGKAFASPVAAGGHIYLCGTDGSVVVRKAGKETAPVSSAQLDDRIAATPAIAGNTIYIRTDRSLYAFAAKE
jgi:outer membrane protein assembly factor BamB